MMLGIAIAGMANAQTIYTLDECINEAVNNNMKMLNASNSVGISAQQRKEAFTKYFPTVSASGTGIAANEHLLQLDMGQMGLSLIKNGVTGNVTVMQPVFAGGQIVNGNKLAKVGVDVSRLQQNLTENEVRLTAETYYWQIVTLKEKLKTIDAVEEQIENVRKDAEAAVEAGVRNRNDLLQVQLRKNEIRATRIEVDNALSLSRDLLAQYVGHPEDSIDVVYNVSDSLPETPDYLYVSPETSLYQTEEYQLLGKQVEANKLNYKLAVGKNLPSLAVGGGYIYNNLLDKSSNKWVGLLTVSIPISGWWSGSHELKRHKLQVQNAENERTDNGQLLVIRMRKAWNDMTDAYKQVGIALESIAQSKENLRLNTDYYQAGIATISDLLDAQTLYRQSRDKYVESYTKYEVKKREYLQATGR